MSRAASVRLWVTLPASLRASLDQAARASSMCSPSGELPSLSAVLRSSLRAGVSELREGLPLPSSVPASTWRAERGGVVGEVRLAVRLPAPLMADLRAVASSAGVSVGEAARRVLWLGLEGHAVGSGWRARPVRPSYQERARWAVRSDLELEGWR